jgi:hypothetical protein
LSSAAGGFDVADADLDVAFAGFAASDEGRVHAHRDRHWRIGWLIRRIVELIAEPQRMAAQCLGLFPASIRSICTSSSAATRKTISAVVPVVWTGSGKNKLRPVAG